MSNFCSSFAFFIVGKESQRGPQPCYGLYHILFILPSRYRAVSNVAFLELPVCQRGEK